MFEKTCSQRKELDMFCNNTVVDIININVNQRFKILLIILSSYTSVKNVIKCTHTVTVYSKNQVLKALNMELF